MKKITSMLLALAALVTLAACGSQNDTAAPSDTAVTQAAVPVETTTAAQELTDTQTTAAETQEAAQGDYKAAYAAVIDSFEAKYGTWKPVEDEIMSEWCGTGILFCDLFDWDQDADPELFIGYSTEQHVPSEADLVTLTDLEVYTFEAGEAKQIVHGKPGKDHMNTSSFQHFYFLRDGDSIVLCLPHSENIWDNETLTQYWYRDGKVTSRELYAQAENYEDNNVPPDLNLFKIDGKKVDKAQYDKAKMETETDTLYIVCNRVDYDTLKAFLRGKADSCRCAFLTNRNFRFDYPQTIPDSEPDILPAWVGTLVSTY